MAKELTTVYITQYGNGADYDNYEEYTGNVYLNKEDAWNEILQAGFIEPEGTNTYSFLSYEEGLKCTGFDNIAIFRIPYSDVSFKITPRECTAEVVKRFLVTDSTKGEKTSGY